MATPYNPYTSAGGWTGAKPTPTNRPQTSTNPSGSGSYGQTGTGSQNQNAPSGGGSSGGGGGGGGAPANPNQSWGSFGTYGNWAQEFANVHGNMPNVQDEADYWDSQFFAAETGSAPTDDDWWNRYFRGTWAGSGAGAGPLIPRLDQFGNQMVDRRGRKGWIPFNGANARSRNFYDRLLDADNAPDSIRGGLKQWLSNLPSRNDTPDWLRTYANDAASAQSVREGGPSNVYQPPPAPGAPIAPTEQDLVSGVDEVAVDVNALAPPPVLAPDSGGGFLGLGNLFGGNQPPVYQTPVWNKQYQTSSGAIGGPQPEPVGGAVLTQQPVRQERVGSQYQSATSAANRSIPIPDNLQGYWAGDTKGLRIQKPAPTPQPWPYTDPFAFSPQAIAANNANYYSWVPQPQQPPRFSPLGWRR